MKRREPEPSEFVCGHCGGDLAPHPNQAWGRFYVHVHNNSVACQWPGLGWSLLGNNADPVRRTAP